VQIRPASAAGATAAGLAVAEVVVVAAAVAYRRHRTLAADARGEIAADPAASLYSSIWERDESCSRLNTLKIPRC
jgi:hypothetical protein